jgi:hypothetical protein
MICPQCKNEYARGVTECVGCGVPLLDALVDSSPEENSGDGFVLVWSGRDPREATAVRAALTAASIEFVERSEADADVLTLLGLFVRHQPKREIYVAAADAERAKGVRPDLSFGSHWDGLTLEELKSLELPPTDSQGVGEQINPTADQPPTEGKGKEMLEVWTGDGEDFAGNLVACLNEVGIAARKIAVAGRWRVLVRSEDDGRAREIVREVVEASPPQ